MSEFSVILPNIKYTKNHHLLSLSLSINISSAWTNTNFISSEILLINFRLRNYYDDLSIHLLKILKEIIIPTVMHILTR